MAAPATHAVDDYTAQAAKAREQLLRVVERCTRDRDAYFPPAAHRVVDGSGCRDLVLMGGQKGSLGHHLDLLEQVMRANPGLRLRALVDEDPRTVADAGRIRRLGADVVSVQEFFAQASRYAGCLVVDRYCTWIPGIKYKAKLRQAGFDVLRLEQFLNAPGLPVRGSHCRAHSDHMLANFDRFMELESLWSDDKSRMVFYTSLAAFISQDFTWFAFGCDSHDERYMPSDIGLRLGTGEIFVDCGAYDGSESILFSERVGRQFATIHAFEPDLANFAVVHRNLARYAGRHGLDNILCYPLGVYERNGYVQYSGHDVTVCVQDAEAAPGRGLFVARLDDVLHAMSYLKLEIEGAELAALRGASGLIRANRPVLAVAAYHLPEDLTALTAYIVSLDLGYRFQLRHQSLEPGVLCIYCQ